MRIPHLAPRHAALVVGATLALTANSLRAEPEKITGPESHENLAIYVIHGADRSKGKTYLTLQEALAQKKAIVVETKNVNQLSIQNVSKDTDIYIQAGDIVKGGQQDRTLGTDLVLEPKAKVPIAAFCVEHGRWSQRGNEAAGHFATANDQVASKDLKLAVKSLKEQGEVWKKVAETQAKLSSNVGVAVAAPESASSLQLTLENQKLQVTADTYIAALRKTLEDTPDAIGFAFAINGKINSADLYGSPELFRKMWPKLLKAAAVEAVAELQKGKSFDVPTVAQVEAALAAAKTGKTSEEKVSKRVKEVTCETKDSVFFETSDQDVALHRNLLVK
jgi:hypothetical protein